MKPCLRLACPNIVPRGSSYCPLHDPGPWGGRGSFRTRYGISRHGWDKLRGRAIRRDGGACTNCGSTERLEVDHVIPRSDGGSNQLGNLATLCHRCHDLKTKADRRAKG